MVERQIRTNNTIKEKSNSNNTYPNLPITITIEGVDNKYKKTNKHHLVGAGRKVNMNLIFKFMG